MSAFSSLHPQVEPWATALYQVAQRYGLQPRVTSTFRSRAEQQLLYDRYRRGQSRWVAAPPGRSLHNYGHAFDLVVNSPQAQEWLGRVWESWGGRWGGRFNDAPHFDTGAVIP